MCAGAIACVCDCICECVCVCVCMYVCVRAYMRACVCACPCVACMQMRMHACATMHLCVCVRACVSACVHALALMRIYKGRTQNTNQKESQNTKKQSHKISMDERVITVIQATCVRAYLRLCVCHYVCACVRVRSGRGGVRACMCVRARDLFSFILPRWISATKELQLKHTNRKTANKWSHLDTYEIQIYTVRLDLRGKNTCLQLVCCAAGVWRACVSVCWCMHVCVLVYGCLRCWGEGTVA